MSKKEREEELSESNERKFRKNFMIFGAMCQSRTFLLIKVPSKAKVDANFYVNFVFKPLINKYLIPHFKEDINKVTIHHDKASSHTANRTKEFMEEMNRKHGIAFLDKKDIPVRGADISPMDFSVFVTSSRRLESQERELRVEFGKNVKRFGTLSSRVNVKRFLWHGKEG